MKTLFTKIVLLVSLVICGVIACKKMNTPISAGCDAGAPGVTNEIPFTILSDTSEISGNIECREEEAEWGPKWIECMSSDPQGSSLFPTGIISFPSVLTGALTPITGNRKPMTISASIPVAGSAGKIIQNPNLSSVRTGINELLHQMVDNTATPAQISWMQTQIYSEKHFALAIGGNYGSLFYDINAQYHYNDASYIGRFLFQFTQVYYSVDVDAPQPGLGNFFNNPPDCSDTRIQGVSPCYVSSVKYGRRVYLMIESRTYSYSHMADLQASFDAFFSSGGLTVDAKLSKLFTENSIKGVIIGGPAIDAIKTVNNPAALKTYLLNGANFDMSSPGVPLSYTLRFCSDNSIASIVKHDKFTIRECTEIPANVTSFQPANIEEVRLNYDYIGDRDFGSNGPKVTMKITLYLQNNNSEVWARTELKMVETCCDHSTGSIVYEKKLWTAPATKKIVDIVSPTIQTVTYTDNNIAYDTFDYPLSEIIKQVRFLGSTDGDDLGLSDIESTGHLHYLKFNRVKVALENR